MALAVVLTPISALADTPPANKQPAQPLSVTSVRSQRRYAVMGQVGWNNFAGLGLQGSIHLTPRVSIDVGMGFSVTGWKGGVRPRFNFLPSNWTPFVGASFLLGAGLGQSTALLETQGNPVKFRVL